jgi:hypothetical protein
MRTYPHMCRNDHIEIGHAYSGDDERCPLCQTIAALEKIREEAATKPNGGAWAAGQATLCLGTLPPIDIGGVT